MVLQPNVLTNQTIALCNQNSSAFFECTYLGGSHGYGEYAGSFLDNNSTGTSGWVEATFIFNGTNSQFFVDGVCGATGNAGANGLEGILIGCFKNLNENFWNGQIGDIIVYTNILSTASQQTVENALRSNYGF
jgi:hypothetical protein